MRGKQYGKTSPNHPHRIIPAHAGQTRVLRFAIVLRLDHPRACGANLHTVTPRSNMPGSSPRMRGKPKADAGDVEARRIIPAHAGQTGIRRFA